MFEQGKRIFQQGQQIDLAKLVLFAAGIRQEVRNDVIQPIGLPGHNLQQLAMLFIERGNAREHGHGPGDRSEGITNFVRDSGRQASDCCEPVVHANFPLQAADLR